MHDQLKKLSSFGFKATLGGPEQDQYNILQDIEQGNVTFVYLSEPESELTMERWRNTPKGEIYQEILIGVAVDEVHCVAEWAVQAATRWFSVSSLSCVVSLVTLAILIMPF